MSDPVGDVRALLRGAREILTEAGVPSPEADARELLAFVLGEPRLPFPLPENLEPHELTRFAELLDRRARREPLQRILGHTAFRYLTLRVAPEVFVPRPETEIVAQVAIDEATAVARERVPVVVDLCCGAGGIALSVCNEVPTSRVVAIDFAAEAVELTRVNAAEAGVTQLRIEPGDVRDPGLLGELSGQVDVVVSNPPYIPPDQVPVDFEVREHDPDLALYGGGADGLDLPRAVVARAVELLVPGGLLVMEHAEVQAGPVRELVRAGGFEDVQTRPDLTGRDRMVVARRPRL
jgi:release factor glutamine methyltransferase